MHRIRRRAHVCVLPGVRNDGGPFCSMERYTSVCVLPCRVHACVSMCLTMMMCVCVCLSGAVRDAVFVLPCRMYTGCYTRVGVLKIRVYLFSWNGA